MNLDLLTVASTRTAVLEKETTATALVDAFYAKIEAEDSAIGAYLTLSKERAYTQASRIDELADRGDELPPLAGVPIAVKDVFTTKGVRTTAASKISRAPTKSGRASTTSPAAKILRQGANGIPRF